jgi:hypothetical protein
MQRNDLGEKAAKTAVLLGFMNFISAPIRGLVLGLRLGIGFMIGENFLALYMLHERGKSERRLSNLATNGASWLGSFFKSAEPSSDLVNKIEANKIENSIKNIVTGGAAITDEISSFMNIKKRS